MVHDGHNMQARRAELWQRFPCSIESVHQHSVQLKVQGWAVHDEHACICAAVAFRKLIARGKSDSKGQGKSDNNEHMKGSRVSCILGNCEVVQMVGQLATLLAMH